MQKPLPSDPAVTLTERNPYTELSIKQRNYVEARLQGLTKAAAGRAAGCSTQNEVYVLERNPKVRAAIRYLLREGSAKVEDLTKSDVLTGMMDAVSAAATASELVMAWREIGKLLGAYEPERKILEVHDYTEAELKELSDKDLARLAGKKMRNVIEDAEFEEVPKAKPEPLPDLSDGGA